MSCLYLIRRAVLSCVVASGLWSVPSNADLPVTLPPQIRGTIEFSCNIAILHDGSTKSMGRIELDNEKPLLFINFNNDLLPSPEYALKGSDSTWWDSEFMIPFKDQWVKFQFDMAPRNGLATFIHVYRDRHPDSLGRNVHSAQFASGVCSLNNADRQK